jgi:hypothetical protein
MNYTPEDMAKHAPKTKQHWHKGEWRCLDDICKMENIGKSTLYAIMHKNQTKTASECVDIAQSPNKRTTKKLPPIARLAKKIGITYASCYARVKKYGYKQTIKLGKSKLHRGGSKGVTPVKARTFDTVDVPSFDADLELKNLITSLASQGLSNEQVFEQAAKRVRF